MVERGEEKAEKFDLFFNSPHSPILGQVDWSLKMETWWKIPANLQDKKNWVHFQTISRLILVYNLDKNSLLRDFQSFSLRFGAEF